MLSKKLVIKVNGMSCNHCAETVSNGLKDIKDVKDVKVNLKNKKVTIKHNGILNVSEIKDKITDLGYDFIGVE